MQFCISLNNSIESTTFKMSNHSTENVPMCAATFEAVHSGTAIWIDVTGSFLRKPEATDCHGLLLQMAWNISYIRNTVLKDEVRKAFTRLKTGKALGIDGISPEIIKAIGEGCVNVMHTIYQEIWETGCWPCDWTTSLWVESLYWRNQN